MRDPMNSTLPSSTLVGRIYHRISGFSKGDGKKRPRPWDGVIGGNDHRGFIFIPVEEQPYAENPMNSHGIQNDQSSSFPIIIPYQYLRPACHAAATGKLIQISQYSLIRYKGHWGELISSSKFKHHNANASAKMDTMVNADQFVVIEVHYNGLCLADGDKPNNKHLPEQNEVAAMTLETLAQKEAEAQQSKALSKIKKNKKSTTVGKDPINITGVVDAISPILVNNDSQEAPFALMELYQPALDEEDTNVKSAVAVIRGENALRMHPAIHPGQSVTLVGVSRRWKVPAEFQKHLDNINGTGSRRDLYQRLCHRVPDRVILITEASAIRWNGDRSLDTQDMSSLPSTVESLTSLRGIVKSVHFHQGESRDDKMTSHVVHFVTLQLLNQGCAAQNDKSTQTDQVSSIENEAPKDPKLARLYLTKYALPPNLELGLQPGSIIRAVNIHSILSTPSTRKCEFSKEVDDHFLCYVACLRTTVAIERCASESYHPNRSSHPRFVTREKSFLLVPDHRISDICSDPFHTRSSAQYFVEEKLRCELESKIGDSLTESVDIEYAQRPTYTDCHDSKPSRKEKAGNQKPSIVDSLLTHHHRCMAVGNLNSGIGRIKGCSCPKRRSNRANGVERGRRTMRDPYGEFFDHAHGALYSLGLSRATECGTSCNNFSSYSHYPHISSDGVPHIAGLEDIRNSCAHNFMKRVAISTRSNVAPGDVTGDSEKVRPKVNSGWTSSHHYQSLNLCQALNDYARSKSIKEWTGVPTDSIGCIYTLGQIEVGNMKSNSGQAVATAYINDGTCAIPFSHVQNEAINDSYVEDKFRLVSTNVHTWLHIDSVTISCLCLGSSLKEPRQFQNENGYNQGSERRDASHTFLRSLCVGGEANDTNGHGFLFIVDNIVFIASVHIIAKSGVSTKDQGYSFLSNQMPPKPASKPDSNFKTNALNSPVINRNAIRNIQECLDQTEYEGLTESPVWIAGRLIRQRFQFRKVKFAQISGHREKCYEGWTLTLSHVDPSHDNVLDIASVLQTVEVKVSVPFPDTTEDHGALKLAINRILGSEASDTSNDSGSLITSDQVTLALAWWAASRDSQTSPLLSGGWDEEHNFASKKLPPCVHVMIPITSRTFSKLGYQRFRCSLDEIKAVFVHESMDPTSPPSQQQESGPCSTEKFLPGMSTRRLRRVSPLLFNIHQGCGNKEPLYRCRNRHSLLTRLKCKGGVPSATLAELHWEICASLKDRNHTHLKPSLLRRINNAKVLGISFCRARVECMKCFKTLTSNGFRKTPTNLLANNEGKKKLHKHILLCPSGCSRSHATVKWECSFIIDDETGQAKVYAEREAALLLLGDSLAVATVEKGAWELDEGVFFQPALPASTHLMECIKDATIKARRSIRERKLSKKEKNPNEDLPSTYSLLPADAKAEYVLQQHCRHWYQHNHHRKMDLFCRCKPLSEDVTTVNQTEIQVAKAWTAKAGLDFGTAPTSTLPPLKLTLEDACVASDENNDDNIIGWNLLNSLKK